VGRITGAGYIDSTGIHWTYKEAHMTKLKAGTVYAITNGVLEGLSKPSTRVSKCGQYGWFWDNATGREVRVHIKHTDGNDPDATKPLPGDFFTEKAAEELELARAMSSELVSARDLKRIRKFKFRVKSRTETIAEELRALEDVSDEYPRLIPDNVRIFALGALVTFSAVCVALGALQLVL